MGNSTLDEVAVVSQMNEDKARLMIPATIYIVVLMMSGLIGNTMVCFFYGIKTKTTTNSFFIVILAVYDLIVCTISMPTEIVDIELFYTFENSAACKSLRFVNYFAAVSSIFTLIAIAVDRFRKIYKPTKKQMTMKMARLVSVAIIGIAILLSWPSLIIYGAIKVNIPNSMNMSLKGSDCTSTKEKSYRPYVWGFNVVHFVTFFICSLALIVLYSIIGRTIYRHSRALSKHTTKGKLDKSDKMTLDNMKPETKIKALTRNKGEGSRSGQGVLDNESMRITLVMIAVTILFIASFVPYLSLTVWRIKEGKHEAEFLSGAGLVGFKIGSRSFLLNSSLNPWIYGIFNRSFRRYFFGRFFCK